MWPLQSTTLPLTDGWQPVLTFIVLLVVKRLIDALLPKGWTFRFSQRYLRRVNGNDAEGDAMNEDEEDKVS